VGLMRAAKLCHGSDFWGLGVDANGVAVPPSNSVFLVTLQRLLHQSCLYRDLTNSARTSATQGERRYSDELYDWGVLFPGAMTARGPAVGVLHVGQECALWYDLRDGVSLYRPVILTAVRHLNGLEERYVVTYSYLDELAHLGELIMDLGPSDIDTRDARLLIGIMDVRSCWDVARQHQRCSSSPPPRVLNESISRTSSSSSTSRMLQACAPTPGAGTCFSPVSVSSGSLPCPDAPLRASSVASLSSQAMLDHADCMSDSFEYDSFFGDAASFSEADVHDLSLVLGDPDPLVLCPPPLSPASSLSTLGDDVPLVPIQRSARYFPGDLDAVALRRPFLPRPFTLWYVASPPPLL
jgi:hypothetical protein